MKIKYIAAALLATSTFLVTHSAFSQAPQTEKPVVVDAAFAENTYELYEGNVSKIDKKTRTIYFKNKEGVSQFTAGPEITNFNQIKKGDHLSVTYSMSVAIELIKTKSDGIRSKVETESASIAKKGEKPAQTISNTTTIIADIVNVDQTKNLVSVKGPSGKITVVAVKNPALMTDIKAGEQVKVVYTDAMAAAITPAKKP
ncbi:hypothetical protein SAMN06295945_0907 [Polynucleobacter meluiroseus]|uniref:Copper binding protein CusF n=1 Tax=Polynucleobacter meluiroseus TaxID=1938814 RepID=A0A240DZH2_9BURK|nr:hypothetical protein [Polynucleobacter meluiroseus]SNX28575.1 hypothetical protein SAMN06295945_0907 [Polynucleobacter meluiroseus]